MRRKKHLMLRNIAFSIMATAALTVWAAGPASAATGWVLQSTPSIAEPVAALDGVSCVSASDCEAVGYTSAGALAENWNGSTWTVQTVSLPGNAELTGVSCVSASYCVAVGWDISSTETEAEIEDWNGSTWTLVPIYLQGLLYGVSCTSTSFCQVVGENDADTGPVVFSWNGSVYTDQPISSPTDTGLTSVSCLSTSDCVAVGTSSSGAVGEHWNGSSWTAANFVQQGSYTWPMSISCGSATSCLATGVYYSTNATYEYALAEVWNGSTWTAENGSSPNDQAFLSGVSCVSTTNCTAVGLYNANESDTGVNYSLAENWNGSSWTIESTPNPSGEEADNLYSISCPSATDCTAVGAWSGSDLSDAQAYAEQWTG
jgi:hypothetical protein